MASRMTARRLSAIARGSTPLSEELAELVRLAMLGREAEQAPDMVVVSQAVACRPQDAPTWTLGVTSSAERPFDGLLGCRVKLVRLAVSTSPTQTGS